MVSREKKSFKSCSAKHKNILDNGAWESQLMTVLFGKHSSKVVVNGRKLFKKTYKLLKIIIEKIKKKIRKTLQSRTKLKRNE